ncbi:MAG: hypothetical protein ACP5VE_15265 [Chthonomonadales bacterium]
MKHLTDTIKRICIITGAVAALAVVLARPALPVTAPVGHISVPIVCDGQETHG